MIRLSHSCFNALSVAVAAPCAFADTVTYADITSSTGTVVTVPLNGVGFTITGQTAFVNLSGSNNINYFVPNGGTPNSPVYIGGNISNAPDDNAIVDYTRVPQATPTISNSKESVLHLR